MMNEELESDIQELGAASVETKGRFSGACTEPSVLPFRLVPPTGQCPGP